MMDLKERRLRKWNDETGKPTTQENLAEEVGCTRENIVSIEQGRTKPSIDLAKKIGAALGFEWTEFFE